MSTAARTAQLRSLHVMLDVALAPQYAMED
jgi:hypothetical protein